MRNRLIIISVLLLAALAGYNGLIHRAARSTLRRHLAEALNHLPSGADCLFVGNSLVEAGCDVAAFESAWREPGTRPHGVNLALGATSPVEHYLILHHALQRSAAPAVDRATHPAGTGGGRVRYVIYGFFDDQLVAPVRGSFSDLVGNRALSYYFADEAAALYAPGSWLKKWQMRLVSHVPMLCERSSLWTRIERLRRRLEDVGMPRHAVNRYGRVEDFAALEAKDVPAFNARCEGVLRAQPGFSAPIRQMVELCRRHGIQLVLVEMPMPSHHRDAFYALPAWKNVRLHLQTLARQNEAAYICAADWVTDDANFEDATHLNERGARLFSARLAASVASVMRDRHRASALAAN